MNVKDRLKELKRILKIEDKQRQILELEQRMSLPDFWSDQSLSNKVAAKLKNLKKEVEEFLEVSDLIEASESDEDLGEVEKDLEILERYTYLNQKYDNHNAIISFYAGAGGDDAQDWTEMLFNMYLKYADSQSFEVQVLDRSLGAEAGIKSASILIKGHLAYGLFRGESGVHRLVRQSPFNAKALRQTSFSLVQVMPEIEEADEVEIEEKDLKIDVFRSGGHGGQSVNTTDSAVRITHLPTGIVAICQDQRSQLQNKETAMKVVRSRLAKLLLEQHKERVSELKGDFSSPEWGNQIRSYVLHPYKLVKDHRTDYEDKDPIQVLNGQLDEFIKAELKYFARQE